jgi:endonuclease V-like protein UPF0215 family
MIPQRLRQVKREIRVLGVAAGRDTKGYTIVGIIFRGNLWLDGVLGAHSNSDDLTTATAEMLSHSPHSGQVRVILLCRLNLPPEARVDASELYVKTGKPVILLGEGASGVWKNEGMDTPYTAEGLSRWTAEAVLRSSTRECATPEALRVASLTLSGLVRGLDA